MRMVERGYTAAAVALCHRRSWRRQGWLAPSPALEAQGPRWDGLAFDSLFSVGRKGMLEACVSAGASLFFGGYEARWASWAETS